MRLNVADIAEALRDRPRPHTGRTGVAGVANPAGSHGPSEALVAVGDAPPQLTEIRNVHMPVWKPATSKVFYTESDLNGMQHSELVQLCVHVQRRETHRQRAASQVLSFLLGLP